MNNPKALERIQKLLRLARDAGATPAEAESALLQAQRIMAENGIEDGEVVDTTGAEEEILDEDVLVVRRKEFWRGRLGVVISRNFRCKMYWNTYARGRVGVHFLGRRSDVAIAKEVYVAAVEVALQQVADFLRIHGGGLKARSAFLAGFADGLAAKYDEQVVQMRASSTALVVVADAGVEAKFDSLRLRTGRRSTVGAGNPGARAAGQAAGRSFSGRRRFVSTG